MTTQKLLDAFENMPLEELERITKHHELHPHHTEIAKTYYRKLGEIDDKRHSETIEESRKANKISKSAKRISWFSLFIASLSLLLALYIYSTPKEQMPPKTLKETPSHSYEPLQDTLAGSPQKLGNAQPNAQPDR